jgi:hypothetical protein
MQEVKVRSHIYGSTITAIHHDVVMVQEWKSKNYRVAQTRHYECVDSTSRIPIITVMQFKFHPVRE